MSHYFLPQMLLSPVVSSFWILVCRDLVLGALNCWTGQGESEMARQLGSMVVLSRAFRYQGLIYPSQSGHPDTFEDSA